MKISHNWLKNYLKTDLSPTEIGRILTDIGLEVEGIEEIESIKGGLKGLVIGEILSVEQHPNADKLKLTKVNVGDSVLPIVCGAPNVDANQKVVVATVGTELFPLEAESSFKIKKSKIRGEVSEGMICAEDEIGLGKDHDGIIVLDDSAQVGQAASEYYNIENDYLIEIGLTPNRADAMGHLGVARDLAAYFKIHNQDHSFNKPEVDELAFGDNPKLTIDIHDEDGCPKYLGARLKNIKIEESPDWLKNHLRSIGLSPINNVVDITNFVMHETGQPLHAFDGAVVGDRIVVRRASEGEKFTTLDEVERELSSEDLMIANASDGMCIAGVFGGIESGVSEKTAEVVLESAYFDPVSIRKSSKRHAVHTDASFRFERGVDPHATEYAFYRAINLLKELTGAELDGAPVKKQLKTFEHRELTFSPDRCRTLIGEEVSNDFIVSVLQALEIEGKFEDTTGNWQLKVPPYRVDVTREADVIEEVLRMYGYNTVKIPAKVSATTATFSKKDSHKMKNQVSDWLSALGYSEIMNNSLNKHGDKENDETVVEILNPLSSELALMRQTMLHGMLESVAYNQNRQYPDLSLYEFGNIYHKKAQGKYRETEYLSMLITGNTQSGTWHGDKKASFFTIKSQLEGVLKKFGINYRVSPVSNKAFEDGLAYESNKNTLAEVGMVSQDLLKKHGIKQDVYYAHVNWNLILKQYSFKVKYQPVAKFPEVKRDLSLLIDKSVSFQEISDLIMSVDRKLLRSVDLFDVYQGKNLAADKKSYAVSMILQDENSTLTDKKVDKVMNKVIEKLKSEKGAELR